jgi:diphthamide biosynthesis protein 3
MYRTFAGQKKLRVDDFCLHQQQQAQNHLIARMADEDEIVVYDEVEIEDMTYDEDREIYHYPCPCGDRFEIALVDLQDESNDIAVCPSCSLMIRVIYDTVGNRKAMNGRHLLTDKYPG